MKYSTEIFSSIIKALESQGMPCATNAEDGIIGFIIDTETKLGKVNFGINVAKAHYECATIFPKTVSEKVRPQVRELMNLANQEVFTGCFKMDEDTGELFFHYWVNCEDGIPGAQTIVGSVVCGLLAVERYGEAFLKVLRGRTTAEKAFAELPEKDW